MCRIGGYWEWGGWCDERAIRVRLAVLAAKQAHGGPDGEGFWILSERGLGLAHRRLAILDLSPAGNQPMQRDQLVITYNGEVYNFQELRLTLQERGYPFTTQTDTEVLLRGWQAWGPSFLERCRGMWAFGLWDGEALWLVRDRFGVKPLYYTVWEGGMAFASELSALLGLAEVSRAVDPNALASYLAYGFIQGPHTVYKRIWQVPPGHYVRIEVGCLETKAWWTPRPWFFCHPPQAKVDLGKAEFILAEAFRYRLVADVPVGLFLSGGVDSSLVAALLARIAGAKVEAFTLGFEEAGWDEAPWAAKVAQALELPHTVHYISQEEVLREVPRLPALYGQPFGDASALAVYQIAKVARQKVKVVLSADGGDELFGGYVRYTLSREGAWSWRLLRWGYYLGPVWRKALQLVGRLPYFRKRYTNLAGKLHKLTQLEPSDYGTFLQVFPLALASQLVEGAQREGLGPYAELGLDVEGAEGRMYADVKGYLVDDILRKVDRATMAVALEAREPFLDEAVLALRASLPMAALVKGTETKRFLRALLVRHLPTLLWERPKQGFSPPVSAWLAGPLAPCLQDFVLSENTPLREIGLNLFALRRLYRRFLAGESGLGGFFWNVLVLGLWVGWLTATPPAAYNLFPATSGEV